MADPTFNIDDYLKSLTGEAAAPAASAATNAAGKAYRLGRFGAKAVRPLGVLAGADQLASGITSLATGGPTVGNAVRTGVGATSMFNPFARAVASGMSLADMVPDSIYASAVDKSGLSKMFTGVNGDSGVLTPGFQSTVDAAGGANAFSASIANRPAAVPAAGAKAAITPTAAPATTAAPAIDPEAQRKALLQVGLLQNDINANRARFGALNPSASSHSPIGGFVGDIMGIKQVAGDNALNTAHSKLLIDAITKGATMRKDASAADLTDMRIASIKEGLRDGSLSRQDAALLAAGRAPATDKFVFQPGDLTGKTVNVGNSRTGSVTQKAALPPVTEDNIKASMTGQKLTREQAIAAYKSRGYDTSGLK